MTLEVARTRRPQLAWRLCERQIDRIEKTQTGGKVGKAGSRGIHLRRFRTRTQVMDIRRKATAIFHTWILGQWAEDSMLTCPMVVIQTS